MAFPVVCPSCLNENHKDCQERSEELQEKRDANQKAENFVCGGSFCICICLDPEDRSTRNTAWYDEVYRRSLAAEMKRNADS